MLKVLVFEYITGGGMRGKRLPADLLREGELMLQAVVADLLAIPQVMVTVLRDDRLDGLPHHPALRVSSVGESDAVEAFWHNELSTHDAVWPIAPESNGLLEALCRDVGRSGKFLLNTPEDGVRLAASKLETISRLARHGLPVVPTSRLQAGVVLPPCVIKPDDGAGCEGARIIEAEPVPAMMDGSVSWVVQPLLEGEAMSLSALFSVGHARLLGCNRQIVQRTEEGFILRGCLVNAVADGDGRWQSLLDGIARAMPELWGYAGVDLLLTMDGPLILEVNPRLTTSYAGLRRALGINPAGLVLDLLHSGVLPSFPVGRKIVELSLEHALAE